MWRLSHVLDHRLEDVCERQVGEVRLLSHLDSAAPRGANRDAAVREADALGVARGARRVHDHRDRVSVGHLE